MAGEKPEEQILILADDIISYMEKVKEINRKIATAMAFDPFNVVMEYIDQITIINGRFEAIVELFEKGEKIPKENKVASLSDCMKQISFMKDFYISMLKNMQVTLKNLKIVRAWATKELEGAERIKNDAGGMAADVTMIRNAIKEHDTSRKIFRFFKRERRYSAIKMREANHIVDNVHAAIGKIDEIIEKIANGIIPNITQASESGNREKLILGNDISRAVITESVDLINHDSKDIVVKRHLRPYMQSAKMLSADLIKGNINFCLNKMKVLESFFEELRDEIEEFEERHGADLKGLKETVKKIRAA